MAAPNACRCVVAREIGTYGKVLELRGSHPSADVLSEPADDEVLKVRVIAAGLAFPDMLIVEGKHITKASAPFVPTNDICGEVVEVGSEGRSLGFRVGDIVFGVATTGGLSEYALMFMENAYHVPRGVSPHIAAGFEVNYGTTWHGLVDLAGLRKGETLLILGASGGVGMAAIDIGKALGARVVACASTPAKLEICRRAGADVLIDYSSDDFKRALKNADDVYGSVDVVYDPVGGRFSEPAMRAMTWGGRFVVVGFASGGMTPKSAIPSMPLNLALLNERKILGVFWGAWKMRTGNEGNRKNMMKMMEMVRSGTLKPRVTKLYDLQNFMEAFDDMAKRRVTGKICVRVGREGQSKM